MSQIPRDRAPDSTLGLLSDGYLFISRRCRRHDSDVFETRLMLSRVFCMMGEEAARVFYVPDRFTRRGAMPRPTLKLLQDRGSALTLDGAAHRRRKGMFMSLMTPERLGRLGDLVAEEWRARIRAWEGMDELVLFPEVEEILCRAVCRWAGVPLAESEAARRTREFAAMIDGAGAVGPRSWRGLLLRTRTERWMRDVVARVRAREIEVEEGSAAHVIAWHRDADGRLLDVAVAAVELINVLRPTVAVARFVVFAALALHEHPEWRGTLQAGDIECFVDEVRRFYPFFPFVGGRVLQNFDWRGRRFAEGDWVLLDIHGTNRDPGIWEEPGAFRPARFRGRNPNSHNFIPQGGGNFDANHRCAGEWATIEILKRAVHLLTRAMRYDVPAQDLSIDLKRIPAVPKSRFVIRNVKHVP